MSSQPESTAAALAGAAPRPGSGHRLSFAGTRTRVLQAAAVAAAVGVALSCGLVGGLATLPVWLVVVLCSLTALGVVVGTAAPEDPGALELRHVPGLSAADAARAVRRPEQPAAGARSGLPANQLAQPGPGSLTQARRHGTPAATSATAPRSR